jgi:hypothetical protein
VFDSGLSLAPAACDFNAAGHPIIAAPTRVNQVKTIAVWDGLTSKRRATLNGLTYDRSYPTGFDINLGKKLVVASGKEGMSFWNSDTGKMLSRATDVPAFSPDAVTLSPDGRRFAAFERGAEDIIVVSVPNYRVIDRLPVPSKKAGLDWMRFDENDSLFAGVAEGVFVWRRR